MPAMPLVHIGRDQLPSDLDISNIVSMLKTGHAVFTLLFAVLGGRLGCRPSHFISSNP